MISKTLGIALKIFNTVSHKHNPQNTNLSGNIGLGESDEILQNLSQEDSKQSKAKIAYGKEVLQKSKNIANEAGARDVVTMERHGSLYENLQELESEIRVLVIGISGHKHKSEIGVGTQVEEIIRSLRVPTLLINREFRQIKKVMIAYNGSDASKKALDMVSSQPMFSNVERYVVNVCKDTQKCQSLLDEAQAQLKNHDIKANTAALSGDAVAALTEFEAKENIDIVAMGAFSHSRLRDAIFGSFTAKMLANSKVPLLLLR
jgi:nucleotide-binding universal stress UspA family protein